MSPGDLDCYWPAAPCHVGSHSYLHCFLEVAPLREQRLQDHHYRGSLSPPAQASSSFSPAHALEPSLSCPLSQGIPTASQGPAHQNHWEEESWLNLPSLHVPVHHKTPCSMSTSLILRGPVSALSLCQTQGCSQTQGQPGLQSCLLKCGRASDI